MLKELRSPGLVSWVLLLGTVGTIALNESGSSYVGPALAATGGTVVGSIRFSDSYPEKEKIKITKDNAVCGAAKYSEDFVVSEDTQGLQNVILTLDGAAEKIKAPSGTTATIHQKKCQYIPHVQAVPAGTVLEIFNDDGILHNVHVYEFETKRTFFNKAQPKFLTKITQRLRKPGLYLFECDVHSHMRAYVAVVDHPYYAVSDEEGQFSIAGIPPGNYKLSAWHEILGTMEKDVTVIDGQSSEIIFEIGENE